LFQAYLFKYAKSTFFYFVLLFFDMSEQDLTRNIDLFIEQTIYKKNFIHLILIKINFELKRLYNLSFNFAYINSL